MKPNYIFLSVLAALYTGVFLTCTSAFAQAPEDQAKWIIQLYDAGQKDTAYMLLEPLKKSARFVPAVLYTRAYMTPDDRALALYKEVIALEPGGTWADRAAYQLVMRYAEKRDSMAAHTWANVLRVNYPRSTMIAAADDHLAGVKLWGEIEEEMTELPQKGKGDSKDPGAKDPATKTPTTKTVAIKKSDDKKVEGKKKDGGKKLKDTTGAAPTETYTGSGMKGYALQVGLFPTKDQADVRAAELRKKNIRAVPLPKLVKGKKQYALVVGPYTTTEEANRKRATVAGACDCTPFMVMVK